MIISIFATLIIAYVILKIFQKVTCGVCTSENKMINKVVIVTGANTGIGFETAKELAGRGAKVILACRNQEKGETARDKIIQATSNLNVLFKHLDLTSFKSVRDFADDILKTETRIDVLINNAGMGNLDNALTENHLPIEVQVNHFSPFLLTIILLPMIRASAPSRIINVSSMMHKMGKVDPETFHKQPRNWFEYIKVYSNTKLANVLFTKKLSEVLKSSGVTVNCLHPGAVNTDIFRQRHKVIQFLIRLVFKTAKEGAQTSIHLAVSPELERVTGEYFVDCQKSTTSKSAKDMELANRLWDLSESVVFGTTEIT